MNYGFSLARKLEKAEKTRIFEPTRTNIFPSYLLLVFSTEESGKRNICRPRLFLREYKKKSKFRFCTEKVVMYLVICIREESGNGVQY